MALLSFPSSFKKTGWQLLNTKINDYSPTSLATNQNPTKTTGMTATCKKRQQYLKQSECRNLVSRKVIVARLFLYYS